MNVVNSNGFTAVNISAYNNAIACLKALLRVGALINRRNWCGENALEGHLTGPAPEKEVSMLLLAAGETIDDTSVEGINYGKVKGFDESGNVKSLHEIPEYLLLTNDLKLCLKHMCRQAIRKHLLYLDPHRNLFNRIHQMELPSIISNYLLYNMTLDATSHCSENVEDSNVGYKTCNAGEDNNDDHVYDYKNDHDDDCHDMVNENGQLID